MVESNTNGDEPRLVLTGGSGARVVLAEADAPGSLHYLLEAEGFQVVGCASDEDELGRVLGQDVRPDVIVLDADVVATSSLVARQLAPEAHVIAVWPDAVQPPPGGERVDPRMVYEELGPAIRRHMDRRTVPVPVIAMPAEEPVLAGAAVAAAAVPVASGSVVGRVASRVSVLSATLITAILLTMGVSFALGGFRWHPSDGPPHVFVPRTSDAGAVDASDPLNGRVPSNVGNGDPGGKPTDHSGGSNDHHGAGGISAVVATTGGGSGDSGGTGDQTGGSGDQTGGSGDQTGGSGDQTGGAGDQGGGQGDQGGGQGDQGGGQGDQGGGQGDQGGSGDHGGGGGQGGDHGGGGQGDQGGDGQHGGGDGQGDQGDQDGDSQGQDEQGGQGDQGGDSQGEDSQGDGSHGDGHGAHSDHQSADDQNN